MKNNEQKTTHSQLLHVELQIETLLETHQKLHPVVVKNKKAHIKKLGSLLSQRNFKTEISVLINGYLTHAQNLRKDHAIINEDMITDLKQQAKDLEALVKLNIEVRQGKCNLNGEAPKDIYTNINKLDQKLEEAEQSYIKRQFEASEFIFPSDDQENDQKIDTFRKSLATFTATQKPSVKEGFDVIFNTMASDSRTQQTARQTIKTALLQLQEAQGHYQKSKELLENNTNLGWYKRASQKKEVDQTYKNATKTILRDAVKELSGLIKSRTERTLEEKKHIANLERSLSSLIDKKEGVSIAMKTFDHFTSEHMEKKQQQNEQTKKRWQFVRENISGLAKLAPKGKTKPLSEFYYKEGLSPRHFHIPGGKVEGRELISALSLALSTGKADKSFKQYKSENPKLSLYDVIERSLEETRGNSVEFFNQMYHAFSKSPDLEKEVVERNFQKVKYLTPKEREEYKITIRNGVLYQGKSNVPFSTIGMQAKGQEQAAFVINEAGELLISSHIVGEFHHSSFMAGERVIAAGTIKVDANGKITEITNESGHYKPSEENIVWGIQAVPNIQTTFHPECMVNILNDPLDTGPRNIKKFMKHAVKYADEKTWNIKQQESSYVQKLYGINGKHTLNNNIVIPKSKQLVKTSSFLLPRQDTCRER